MYTPIINIIVNLIKYEYEFILDNFFLKSTITLPIFTYPLPKEFWYDLFDKISYKLNSSPPRKKNIDRFIESVNLNSYGWVYLRKKWSVYFLPQTIIIWKIPHIFRNYLPIITT